MDELKQRGKLILEKLDLNQKKLKIKEIEAKSTDPTFWSNSLEASTLMKELSQLQKELEMAEYLELLLIDANEQELQTQVEQMEVHLYFSGKYDKGNAIVTIHAGQGGADAMDWASMLLRMYTRFFERKHWSHEVIDLSAGEEAGVKSVSMIVTGEYVYGYMRGEQGVHRLVRLSPFNSDKLRHTSFALVEILPQVEQIGLEIKEDDLEWEFYRASSHGGQNVQKVSSAVRLKHKPTGIIVSCQTQRYQAQNREYALKLLKAKLWAHQEAERQKKEKALKGAYIAPSWGNQIRSYVFHPYQMVKDLRTKVETSNVEAVMDGEIEIFIDAQLKETG